MNALSTSSDRHGHFAVLLACVVAALFGLLADARAQAAPPGRSLGAVAAPRHAPAAQIAQRDRPPGSRPGDGGPSPVIFPPQRLPLRFDHQKHVKGLNVPCTACHDAAKTSRNSADSLLPPATRCDACHGTDHRKLSEHRAGVQADVRNTGGEAIGECAFCHEGYQEGVPVERVVVPAPNLRFDHAVHLERGMNCQACHGNVENVELATVDQLPRMRACLSCHQHPQAKAGEASGACPTCHLSSKDGLLKTQFASGELLPPAWLHNAAHGGDWIERHKKVAGDESRFCANCHTERFCTACHDGQVRPRRVHPNDWISMHPVAARQGSPTCTSCHRQQSFCRECHSRTGVSMTGPLAATRERGRFHPPSTVWTDGPRGRGHHAWEAERNLNACVSCHTERDCAICHATTAVGGRGQPASLFPGAGHGQGANPHPRGFRDRCSAALRANARQCLVCHDPADPLLRECR
jgi:hypothetical protein